MIRCMLMLLVFPSLAFGQTDPATGGADRKAVCGALSRAAGVDRRIHRRRIALESAGGFR